MKPLAAIAVLVLAAGSATPLQGASRTLAEEVPLDGVRTVVLDSAVGDVEVRAVEGGTIRVTVELRARKGRLFGSRRKGIEQVERTGLLVERSGSRLRVGLDRPSGNPLFEADWILELPPSVGLQVDLGVGDIRVEGLIGDVEVDSGVGDVTLDAVRGDVSVDLGVGEVRISAPLEAYGRVKCSTGVGDCRLVAGTEELEGSGMISKSLTWRGEGPSNLHVDTGVGSVTVILER